MHALDVQNLAIRIPTVDTWWWFRNCRDFDLRMQELRVLQAKVESGQASENERAQYAVLDEQLTEDLFVMVTASERELKAQMILYPLRFRYIDSRVEQLRFQVENYLFSPDGVGALYLDALVDSIEAAGVATDVKPVRGLAMGARSIVNFIRVLKQIERQKAELLWRSLERRLMSDVDALKSSFSVAFNDLVEDVTNHIRTFRNGEQLCAATFNNIQYEYREWDQNESLLSEILVRSIREVVRELGLGLVPLD